MRIIKNYLYNAGYQIFLLIVPFITLPYISRVLGPTGVGINSYTNSIIQYFVLFGGIGINLYGNREIAYVRDNNQRLTQYFWEIELLRIFFVFIAIIAFFIYLPFGEYKNYLLMQSFQLIAVALDISWLFMGIENFKVTVLRNTLVKVISVILIFTFVKSKYDTGIYILILSISFFAANLTLWPYLKKLLCRVGLRKLRPFRHLRAAISLFIPQVAMQIYLIVNKTMLGKMVNVQAAGYFDNADKIITVVLAVVTATGTVMIPRVAHTYSLGDFNKVKDYLYSIFEFVSLGTFPLMFGLMALGNDFSIWFFGKDFSVVGMLIVLEAPAALMIAWNNVLGKQYLLPTNQTRKYTISVIVGSISSIVLNLPLIYIFGTFGASISTVISQIIVTAIQFLYIKKNIDTRKLFNGTFRYFISGMIMFVFVKWVNSLFSFNALTMIIDVISGLIIYFILIFILKTNASRLVLRIIINYRKR